MVETFALIQTAAAVITALAAAGAFAYVRRGMNKLAEHERVLFGEEAVDGWGGIVPLVHENKSRSKRNRYLLTEHHDLDDDDILFRGGGD